MVLVPRRAEGALMNTLGRIFHALRVWTALADPSESRLTPSHGWLLPTPADARRQRAEADTRRALLRRGSVRG
jgi:hypothetical protein